MFCVFSQIFVTWIVVDNIITCNLMNVNDKITLRLHHYSIHPYRTDLHRLDQAMYCFSADEVT